jgi:hypothetical protein
MHCDVAGPVDDAAAHGELERRATVRRRLAFSAADDNDENRLDFRTRTPSPQIEIVEDAHSRLSEEALRNGLCPPAPFFKRHQSRPALTADVATAAIPDVNPQTGTQPESEVEYTTCLDRRWVQQEIRWARQHGKNIIALYEADHRRPGFFDHGKARRKYAGTEFEDVLELDAVKFLREDFEMEAMLASIQARTSTQEIEPAENPLNQPGAWVYFASHDQTRGGDQMQILSQLLDRAGLSCCWYDLAMLNKSEDAMAEGVRHCQNFILFLTGGP